MFEKAFVDLRVSLIQQEELTLTNGMLVAQMVKRLSAMQETWVRFLGWKDPLEKEMAVTLVFLPGKCHGPWSLVGYCSWGHKELDTTERDFTFTLMECLLLLKGLPSKHSYNFWKMILVLHALLFLPGYRV